MNKIITRIGSKEEWEDFYYYSKSGYKPKKYPKSYPCFAKKEDCDGGIGGDYVSHYVCYAPKKYSASGAFLAGLEADWIQLC